MDEYKVPVPPHTAREIAGAHDHLRNASAEIMAAARRIKVYSPDSSVLAVHIEQQVAALAERVKDLLDGCEVVS